MCYIAVVKQLGKKDAGLEQLIKATLSEKLADNNDGAYLGYPKTEVRILDEKVAQKSLQQLETLDGLMTHFRWASAGVISEANIHGWHSGPWRFIHNGTVNDYVSEKLTQQKTDSQMFFEDLMRNIDFYDYARDKKDKRVVKAINSLTKKVAFWGRAALYNMETDRMFLFGDWETYCLGDKYLLFSSAALDFDIEHKVTIHGLEMSKPSLVVVAKSSIDGVAVIKEFSTPDFTFSYYGELASKPFFPPSYEKEDDYAYDFKEPHLNVRTYAGKTKDGRYAYAEESGDLHEWHYDCCAEGSCPMVEDILVLVDNPS